jgi:transcriptional regulator with XRE-family HTH domain
MEPFVREVRRRAAALGITQSEIARRSGVSIRAFSHYLSQRSEPNLATLVRIADVLACTPNDLLGFGESVSSSKNDDNLKQRITARCRQLDGPSLRLVLILVEGVETWQAQAVAGVAASNKTDQLSDAGDDGKSCGN